MSLIKSSQLSINLKHGVFMLLCLVCLYPIALVIGISFSDELEIAKPPPIR